MMDSKSKQRENTMFQLNGLQFSSVFYGGAAGFDLRIGVTVS